MDKTLILDISSDDDVGFDDSSTADNFDWISKLFDDTPLDNDLNFVGNGCGGDDDDVVVVGETIPNPKKAKVSLSKCGFNDDDDCVVLDCDPDKKDKAETKNCDDRGDGGGGDNDDDDDELVIVGEKGQVACRDYPHSRHLCAKFPFSSTPHESRCDLCHCYVCDSLAPCAYWGSGVSTIDHCHANDKEEYWQLERKKVRQSKNGPTPITKPSAAPVLRLPRLPQNSLRAHQATRTPSTCGVPSSFGRPNIISQGKTLRPNMTMARTRFQPHLVSQQLVRTCNSSIQSNRGPTLPSMHPVFKRCGYPNRGPSEHLRQVVNRRANSNVNTCLTNSTSTNGLSSESPAFGQISGFQGCGIPSAVTSDSLYVSTSVNQTQNIPSPTIFQYSSDSPTCDTPSSQQPSAVISDSLYVSTSVNQAQNVSSPTILQYSSGSPNCETPSSQQPCAVISDSLFVSTSVNQTQYVSSPGVVHQYSIDAPNCDAQSNQQPANVTSTLVNESLNVSNPSILQYSYASNCYTQSNQQPSVVLSNITDLISHGHPSSAPNCIAENIQQPSNVTHNLSHPTFTCQQPSVQSSSFLGAIRQPCMNGLQVQGALPLHDLSSLNEQNPPLSCNASSSPLDLDIESWLSDNEPIIGSQDGSYFCDMNNNQPAVTAPVDTGMLYFDFETSWKGLTHS